THISFLEICHSFLDCLRSSIHSQFQKIICHLVQLSCMLFIMLTHIGQKSQCLIFAIATLAISTMRMFLMIMFMSMGNHIAIFVFNQMHVLLLSSVAAQCAVSY